MLFALIGGSAEKGVKIKETKEEISWKWQQVRELQGQKKDRY